MKKLNELRKHLLGLNHLSLQEDTLHTFVESDGKAISHRNTPINTGFGADLTTSTRHSKPANMNFKLEYTASLIITDYADDFNVLVYEIVQWLDKFMPNRNESAFTFQADIISNTSVDLHIKIKLDDLVTVTQHDNGVSIDARNCPAPTY